MRSFNSINTIMGSTTKPKKQDYLSSNLNKLKNSFKKAKQKFSYIKDYKASTNLLKELKSLDLQDLLWDHIGNNNSLADKYLKLSKIDELVHQSFKITDTPDPLTIFKYHNEVLKYNDESHPLNKIQIKIAQLYSLNYAAFQYIQNSTNYISGAMNDAIKAKDIEVIKLLLKYNIDDTHIRESAESIINGMKKNEDTPLHCAVSATNTNIGAIKRLLKNPNIDQYKKNKKGETALHIAALKGNIKVIELLLESGVDVNIQNITGRTILTTAVLESNVELTKLLLEKYNADVSKKDVYTHDTQYYLYTFCMKNIEMLKLFNHNEWHKNGETALHKALSGQNTENATELLSKTANNDIVNKSDITGKTPLHMAVSQKNIGAIISLLRSGAKVDIKDNDGNTALGMAYLEGDTDLVNLLYYSAKALEYGDGNTALHVATSESDVDTIESLLKYSDINIKNNYGSTPLHKAIFQGQIEAIKSLLKSDADVNIQNKDGNSPLYEAILKGATEVIKLLLESGANVNLENNYGNSPIHIAALNGDVDAVKLLLNNGAKVNIWDKDGNTALHIASSRGNIDVVKLLLDYGAKVNIYNHYGDTALHAAALEGNADIVTSLLKSSSNVHVWDMYGNTPLHAAALRGNIKVIKLLLESGAKVNVLNKDGRTASDVAAFKGNTDIVKLLTTSTQNIKNSNYHEVDINKLHEYDIYDNKICYNFTQKISGESAVESSIKGG